MADYEVSRATGCCSVSGRTLSEGETFYTVLFETPTGFERRDISEECWQGAPEGSYCHFKTRMPVKQERKKMFVDDDVLVNFFLRLADSEQPLKQRFRFVLSLILMRKRLLKYQRTIREGDSEFWELRLVKDQTRHKVLNPSLDDSQIEDLTGELASILSGHVPAELGDDLADSAAEASDEGGASRP